MRLGILIASLALCGTALAANPVVAADPGRVATPSSPPPDGTVSRVLPQKYLPSPMNDVWPGSSSYVSGPVVLDAGVGYRYIWRVADGTVVRKVRVTSMLDRAGLLSISGVHAMWHRRATGTTARTVTAENLTTGTKTVVKVPAGDTILAAHPGWVLTARGERVVHLLRGNGTDQVVHSVGGTDAVLFHDADPTAAIVSDTASSPSYRMVDIATGTTTEVPGPILTPTRVFDWRGGSSSSAMVTWATRTSPAEVHTVEVQAPVDTLTTVGDGLATLPVLCDTVECYDALAEIRPVDLETGAAGEPIVDDVVATVRVPAVLAASDGGLVFKRKAGGPGGQLAVLRAGEQAHPVTDLRATLAEPRAIGWSGSRVAVNWRELPWNQLHEFHGGQWSPVIDPVRDEPVRSGTFQLAGDVLLVDVTREEDVPGDTHYWRLIWPGGSRSTNTYDLQRIDLGGRGRLFSIAAFDAEGAFVYDVRSGRQVLRTTTYPALDGTWAWVLNAGVLVGRDTARPGVVKRVRSGVPCKQPSLRDVRGRWALVMCTAAGWETAPYVVDLRGGLRPWRAPGVNWKLGNDFLINDVFTIRTVVKPVRVIDLSRSHQTRTIGHSLGQPVANDSSVRALAWVDPFGRVVIRRLDWVGEAPKRDRTAPRLRWVDGSPRFLTTRNRTAAVNFRWKYVDPANAAEEPPVGVAGYKVRYRVRSNSAKTWSAWRHVSRTRPSLGVSIGAGRTVCFQVRAYDKNQNWSAWAGMRCTTVRKR